MTQKHLHWLTGELPKLVEQNIISLEQQQAIAAFYEREKTDRPNIALIAFSIFGTVLLAAGIILILAHNWSALSRPVRTAISFLPLLIGQAIGLRTLVKRGNSIAWCEGVAAFLFLSIGSTIALISQTYHIQGSLETYLFTWMLLGLPLVYVFSSTTASVFYLAGISSWAVANNIANSSALAYWLLLVAVIPLFFIKNTAGKHAKQATIIGWCISLSLIAGISVGHNSITEGFRVISFISLFLILYSIGSMTETERSIWSSPFHRVGILGLAVTYLFLSYRDNWDNFSYKLAAYSGGAGVTGGDWVVCLGLPLVALILAGIVVRRGTWIAGAMVFGMVLAFLGFGISGSVSGRTTITALFNLYVFAGGVAYMIAGIRANQIGIVNFGFALVAAVVILRFFDADLSFVLRGIIFVVLGAGFLATNAVLAKRRSVA